MWTLPDTVPPSLSSVFCYKDVRNKAPPTRRISRRQIRFSGKRREILDFMDQLSPIGPATMNTRVKYARTGARKYRIETLDDSAVNSRAPVSSFSFFIKVSSSGVTFAQATVAVLQRYLSRSYVILTLPASLPYSLGTSNSLTRGADR